MIKISYVVFKELFKRYKGKKFNTLENINLEISKGEFVVIVGPSGSGKSTLLEIICGFEEVTSGIIELDGKVINDIEPKDRNISMVFQNYALLPHLTAYENIAFGMKIRKVDKKEIHNKVMWAASILNLQDCLNAKPKNLSGGQRQRIALARAIVREPKLFLMDEPLSNLDSKLRNQTSNEITTLHKKINATTIYVTHDQVEALTMADKIVILNDGVIQQIGSPKEIYKNPNNIFVAQFIGKPEINLFDLEIKKDELIIEGTIKLKKNDLLNNIDEGKYILGVRSENIKINLNSGNIKAKVEKIEYLGSEYIVYLNYLNKKFTSKVINLENINLNDELYISFDLNEANIFNKNNKRSMRGE